AYPLLIRNLIPAGVRGFIFAAIAGAVISSLASMLNSASTIFTMDIYKRHLKKDASQHSLVTVGRITTLLFVVIGCILAPQLGADRFKGIFNYIQEFQGFISPGILAAFVFGMGVKRTPPAAGVAALILNVPVYGLLLFFSNSIAFLNRMAITFVLLIATMTVITVLKPLAEPRVMPVREDFDMLPAKSVAWMGAGVIIVTVVLYGIFW
ncbi:MAG: solute:sodium symporter family transporter, partial [Candidatus Latescibacteria bacterium]|nr:solute:sodium symporter family transporter [Candidatus Latescibacterota bacterium]